MMEHPLFDRLRWSQLRAKVARLIRTPDADDHLNAAFLKLEAYRQKEEVHNPEAFLLRTALNAAMDQHRRTQRFPHVSVLDEIAAPLTDEAPLPDELYAVRQRLDQVKEALGRLPPRTREIFLMHRLDGLKYHEIAAKMNISRSAVEKHVAKAMLFLLQQTEG